MGARVMESKARHVTKCHTSSGLRSAISGSDVLWSRFASAAPPRFDRPPNHPNHPILWSLLRGMSASQTSLLASQPFPCAQATLWLYHGDHRSFRLGQKRHMLATAEACKCSPVL